MLDKKNRIIFIVLISLVSLLTIAVIPLSYMYISTLRQPAVSENTPPPASSDTQESQDNIAKDEKYQKYKSEVLEAVEKTLNKKVTVTTTIKEEGQSSVSIVTYDLSKQTFSGIEKNGDWQLNFSEIYNLKYINGEIVKTDQKTGKEVERRKVTFDELKPIDINTFFSLFEEEEEGFKYNTSMKSIDEDSTTYYFVVTDYYENDLVSTVEVNTNGVVTKVVFSAYGEWIYEFTAS